MAHEPNAVRTWLYNALSGNAPLAALLPGGFWKNVAGANAQTPYVVWSVQGGSDDNTAGARAYADVMMSVRVVSLAGTDDDAAEAALDLIDGLLSDKVFDEAGLRFRIKSAGVIDYPEPAPGTRQFNHQGRVWRFILSNI